MIHDKIILYYKMEPINYFTLLPKELNYIIVDYIDYPHYLIVLHNSEILENVLSDHIYWDSRVIKFMPRINKELVPHNLITFNKNTTNNIYNYLKLKYHYNRTIEVLDNYKSKIL